MAEARQRLARRYAEHHARGGRYGFTYRVDERGRLLAGWVGQGRRVLDLGCRDGTLTRHYVAGNTVTGVDVDQEALARARAALGIETCWLDLNAEALPFAAESFDAVVAAEVLEHLVAPAEVVGEAARVLRPGGLLVGSLPNAFHWRGRLAFLRGRSDEDPTHLHLASLAMVRTLLAGFAPVEIVPLGSIGGRLVPTIPPRLARAVIARWPTLFASDFGFRAVAP